MIIKTDANKCVQLNMVCKVKEKTVSTPLKFDCHSWILSVSDHDRQVSAVFFCLIGILGNTAVYAYLHPYIMNMNGLSITEKGFHTNALTQQIITFLNFLKKMKLLYSMQSVF